MKRIANPDYIVNNADWLSKMTMVDFIRDACAHFSVNQMLTMETFENRLSNQNHLSLMEFMYTPMQAYDFAHLYRKYGCEVQCGGSDQFGNICQGIGYVKKVVQDSDPQGLTFNLLVNSKGEKMGKTVAGAVYLDDSMVSAYDFWQYFRNVDDADVRNVFLKLTELEVSEIDDLVEKDIIKAKKVLADEVTKLVHGPKKTLEAREKSENMFEKRDFDTATKVQCRFGTTLDEVSLLCSFVSSKSEAKNAIRAGSVTINGQKCLDPKFGDLKDGDVICFGKKKFYKIIIF
jgi:tyrosyl-tRNA synthetase